ncbi:hypothetical protein RFN25_27360 [Mesorhizobium abyssinicae]|uniref:HoxN/HupN/NixA family nickel/cobalt transporter n=1 Tax=Mesorhizobium abyssinicae TaxID=1209958 RepID=UPI002A243E4B|nr:hypothetical protein [Mesorhizobium abyssinicae]MDX8437150.1 hypothetical protein [Mesorhizobium abyssinicae]
MLASLAIAGSAAALQGRLERFHDVGGMIGTCISALFLLAIGIANLFILKGTRRQLQQSSRAEKSLAKAECPLTLNPLAS